MLRLDDVPTTATAIKTVCANIASMRAYGTARRNSLTTRSAAIEIANTAEFIAKG
jgi:hypothetical protein